ncbi:SRPBCC family protein [Paenibacillus gansuensis]|uniref:SRPBCC family protein n=1 Tax=Paenibacillus gansuensis TaxID=306542 RepID=A0ABW5P7S7_9BACL
MVTFINEPVVKAEMLIRRPVQEVFDAFINPEITTKFWFTKSSGRLETGKTIRWDWEMYGVGDDILVKEIHDQKRILIESSYGGTTEWIFHERGPDETYVSIINKGFTGSGDEMVSAAIDSMGGYTMVLCGLKALLEYNVILNLVADKAPDAHV